jgi:hypothetical protein
MDEANLQAGELGVQGEGQKLDDDKEPQNVDYEEDEPIKLHPDHADLNQEAMAP